MKSILVHLRIWVLAFSWVGKINIGARVNYKGKTWMVSNGVSRPKWSLFRAEPHEYLEYVHQDDFKLIQNPKEWFRAFNSGCKFYYGYWFRIWVREPIKVIPFITINSWLKSRSSNK